MIGFVALTLALGAAAPVDAYVLAWRGDLVEARAAVSSTLAAAPADPSGLVIGAAVEIELGDLRAADARVARLASLTAPPAEAAVLRELVGRRRRAPAEPMLDAVAAAWKSAGRPDLGAGGVLKRLRDAHPVSELVATLARPLRLERLGPTEAFLVGGINVPDLESSNDDTSSDTMKWSDRRAADARRFAREPTRNTVAVNLCASRALDDDAARERVLGAAAAQLPDNGYVALERLVGARERLESPLTDAELDALATAVRAAAFVWPTDVVYREILDVARKLDAAHAELIARLASAACSSSIAPARLLGRIDATTDPDLLVRALEVEDALASRLAASGRLLDRMMGAIARAHVAHVRGDEQQAKVIGADAERWRARLRRAADAALFPGGWPLPSLWRAWDPAHEVQTLERLVR